MKLPAMTPVTKSANRLWENGYSIPLTKGKANVVETVEQREPVRLKSVRPLFLIPVAELLLKRVHGLGARKRLIVKAIVEGRHGNEHASECEPPVKKAELGKDPHDC